MSENAPPSPVPPPAPGGKTPTTPLKKETVRITLRAKPGEGVPAEGVAPVAPTAPLRPPAPRPPGVTPGIARPAAPPPPAGAVGSRTIPLTPPGAPRPVAPAPGAPAAPPAPAAPAPTRPAATAPLGGAPAQSLSPQPTVRLQPQRPAAGPTAAVSSAPLKPAAFDDDEEESSESGLNVLAGIVTALAALFLIISLLGWDEFGPGVADDPANPGWKLPRPAVKPAEDFARETAGGFVSDLKLEEIPDAPVQ